MSAKLSILEKQNPQDTNLGFEFHANIFFKTNQAIRTEQRSHTDVFQLQFVSAIF